MTSVTDRALARLKASSQNRISTNSSLGDIPIGCTRYTARSRTDSSMRTNVLPSEKRITVDLPTGQPRYLHIRSAKACPPLPAKMDTLALPTISPIPLLIIRGPGVRPKIIRTAISAPFSPALLSKSSPDSAPLNPRFFARKPFKRRALAKNTLEPALLLPLKPTSC